MAPVQPGGRVGPGVCGIRDLGKGVRASANCNLEAYLMYPIPKFYKETRRMILVMIRAT